MAFVAETLSGHTLTGWRYWAVQDEGKPDATGRRLVTIMTGSIDHPTLWNDKFKYIFGGKRIQRVGWDELLRRVAVDIDPKYHMVNERFFREPPALNHPLFKFVEGLIDGQ